MCRLLVVDGGLGPDVHGQHMIASHGHNEKIANVPV